MSVVFKRIWVFSVVLCSVNTAASAEILDMVLASVDKEAILYSEIMVSLGSEINRLQREATSLEELDAAVDHLVEQGLEEAIENKILYREAQKFSIEIPDENIEARIDRIRNDFDTNEEFMAILEDAGETLSDLRVRERKRMMAQMMGASKMNALEGEVVVTEAEVAQYYEDNKDQYQRPERVRLRQIELRAPRNSDERRKAIARLEMLREELDAGADFSELAKAHSEGLGAEDGGIIGWTDRGSLQPALEEAAFSLKEGDVSQVLESQFAVYLMMAEKKEEAGIASLSEVRSAIEPRLRTLAAIEKYDLWMRDLRKRSRVRVFF